MLNAEGAIDRSYRGGPKLPRNSVCFVVFLLLCRACVVLRSPASSSLCLRSAPKSGEKSKRISLDADIAIYRAMMQPVRQPLAVVLLFYRLRSTLESSSSPKESVSYASALLFFLCWSRYVLFLLDVRSFLFLLCQIQSMHRANFKKFFLINVLYFLGEVVELEIKTICYGCPRYLLRSVCCR